ncbi:MAG: heme-binding domain-containing protein [Terriglobia bacterium]
MKALLKGAGITIIVFLAGSQFIRPAKTNPPIDETKTMEAYVQTPDEVSSILRRACQDCHSNMTRWPWYSNAAPVSWFVIDHVNHGRKHLNFSDWNHADRHGPTLGSAQQLDKICKGASSGEMPLSSYLLLHPNAWLSPQDAKVICVWTRSEQERFASFLQEGLPLSAKP